MQDYTLYEHQVCEHFQNTSDESEFVWHWTRIPIEELMACGWTNSADKIRLNQLLHGITPKEFGLDGLARMCDGSYTGIQAKKRLKLYPEDLGSFLLASDCLRDRNPHSRSCVYYSGDLTETLHNIISNGVMGRRGIDFVHTVYDENFFMKEQEIVQADESTYTLYPVQQYALDALAKWEGGMTILNMPCGVGKTIVYGKHSQKYQYVIVISPYRIHAQQNLTRMRQFLPHHVPILVDSDVDGTRCVEEIREMLESGPCLLSATMKSADVLLESMPDDLENYLVIVDEAHKLPYEAKAVELAEKFQERCLLASATPVTCIGGYEDVPMIYSLNLRDAIQQGYITDYCVVLPTVASKEDNELVDLKDLDEYYAPRVQFMMAAMVRFGLRRCIVYLPTVAACERFLETCGRVAKEYHGRPFWGSKITNDTKYREKILDDFESGDDDTLKVMASVRILDEGIDVVRCDSVFFTEVPTTKCTDNGLRVAIQRICRANRKDPIYQNKVAHAMIWADEDHAIPNFLGMLKEMDPEFGKHIKRIARTYQAIGTKESNEEERTETEELIQYIVRLKLYDCKWMVEQKVQALCREYATKRPIKGEIVHLNMNRDIKVNLAMFWDSIKNNFMESTIKATTKLSQDQIQRIRVLPWVQPAIDKLLQNRSKRSDLSIDDRINILCHEYPYEKPRDVRKSYFWNNEHVELSIGQFWNSVKDNFTQENDKKAAIILSEQQMQKIASLPWVQNTIRTLTLKRNTRAPISKEDRLNILCTEYIDKKPTEGKRLYKINGIDVQLSMAGFWRDIIENFTQSGRKLSTMLNDEQKKRVLLLPWVHDAISKLNEKREQKVDVSVQDKVNILCREYLTQKPTTTVKRYILHGVEVELSIGYFWQHIVNNFIPNAKKIGTTLTTEQKTMVSSLPWVQKAIHEIIEKRRQNENITFANDISLEEKIDILCIFYKDTPPVLGHKAPIFDFNGKRVKFSINRFWYSIVDNFFENDDNKPKIVLSSQQKDRIRALPWVDKAVEHLITWRKK